MEARRCVSCTQWHSLLCAACFITFPVPPYISWAQQRKTFPLVKQSWNHSNLSSVRWFYYHSGSKFLDLLLLSDQSALYICIITSVCLIMCHCELLSPLWGYEFLSATVSKKSGQCLKQSRIWLFVSTFDVNILMKMGRMCSASSLCWIFVGMGCFGISWQQ